MPPTSDETGLCEPIIGGMSIPQHSLDLKLCKQYPRLPAPGLATLLPAAPPFPQAVFAAAALREPYRVLAGQQLVQQRGLLPVLQLKLARPLEACRAAAHAPPDHLQHHMMLVLVQYGTESAVQYRCSTVQYSTVQ